MDNIEGSLEKKGPRYGTQRLVACIVVSRNGRHNFGGVEFLGFCGGVWILDVVDEKVKSRIYNTGLEYRYEHSDHFLFTRYEYRSILRDCIVICSRDLWCW